MFVEKALYLVMYAKITRKITHSCFWRLASKLNTSIMALNFHQNIHCESYKYTKHLETITLEVIRVLFIKNIVEKQKTVAITKALYIGAFNLYFSGFILE